MHELTRSVTTVAATEAQLRANKKYQDKFERIQIRVPHEEKVAIEAYAESIGESVNSFVRRVVAEAMQQDTSAKKE